MLQEAEQVLLILDLVEVAEDLLVDSLVMEVLELLFFVPLVHLLQQKQLDHPLDTKLVDIHITNLKEQEV
jgi:hypothetical protein